MKKTKLILTLTLALACMLCMVSILPAFAAPAFDGTAITDGEFGDEAALGLTKIFQMPEGTALPSATFSFTATKASANGVSVGAEYDAMPAISIANISFAAGDTGATADSVTSYTKTLSDVFGGKTWPGTGVFVYTVRESAGYTAGTNEFAVNSPAEYTVRVYVKYDDVEEELYVWAISAQVAVADNASQTVGDKVDDLLFTNKYTKTKTTTVEDDNDLIIAKLTSGDFANQNEDFSFTLTITLPTLIPAANAGAPYSAVVLDASDAQVGTKAIANGANTFTLKHGQRLVVPGLPVGTVYTVSENNPTNYEPSFAALSGGASAGASTGSLSATLTTGSIIVADGGENSARFLNERNDIPVTGLNLNDLPFVLLIGLALACVAGYVVAKTRKAKKAMSH